MTDMTEAAKVLLDSYLPYFVIEFPVNAEGNGPASSDDVDKVLYEIWDAETLDCLQSHEQLSSAISGWLKLLSEYTKIQNSRIIDDKTNTQRRIGKLDHRRRVHGAKNHGLYRRQLAEYCNGLPR